MQKITNSPQPNTTRREDLTIIYDGECLFCRNYTRLINIRANFSNINIINARDLDHEMLSEIKKRNLNLDDGMIVKINETWSHGSDAINTLAFISTPTGAFNKLNSIIFKSPRICKVLYPFMRQTRNLFLLMNGKKKINNLQKDLL